MKWEKLQSGVQSAKGWLASPTYKTWRRRALAGVVTVAMLGGVGVGSAHYYEGQQKAKLAAARSGMIRSDAAAHHVTLLDEAAIRSITAKAVNVDENQLTFERVNLTKFKTDKDGHKAKHHKNKSYGDDEMHDAYAKHSHKQDREYKDGDYKEGNHKDRNHKEDHSWNVASIPEGLSGHRADMTPAQQGEGAIPPVQVDGHADSNGVMSSIDKNAAASSATATAAQGTQANNVMPKNMTKMDGYIHPVYKVRAAHDGVVYKLVIDAVDGHVIANDVDSASPFDIL
ncbi:hypothetical protein [Veillonella magna]|uniref:hypothetical protein n=1 Tax=Veillonella magna TaxID=464322 RepID=UPI0026666C84|nr:hypothetical protein [Veillonella magna]